MDDRVHSGTLKIGVIYERTLVSGTLFWALAGKEFYLSRSAAGASLMRRGRSS